MDDRVILSGLDPAEYVHPMDREARTVLERVPGLTPVVRKFNEVGYDRLLILESMASKVRVTPRQFPELYELFQETKSVLGISWHVDLFVQQQFSLNAFAAGVEYPHVTLTTELLSHLTQEELRFVLGHELGHIHCQHILYHQIGIYLPRLITLMGSATLGLGALVGTGFEVALYDWIRKSEFSADRAGLLACQDLNAAKAVFCRFAGVPRDWFDRLNLEEIHRQADDFQRMVTSDSVNRFYRFVGQMWNTHPWVIVRFSDLLQWIDRGVYDAILNKKRKASQAFVGQCTCGEPFEEGSFYCIACGRQVANEKM